MWPDHLLQHMAVAYIGADQQEIPLTAKFMQAQVGHNRGYDSISVETTLASHSFSAHGQYLVAIDNMALFIHQQAAVGVAVKGDTQVVLPCHYAPAQGLHMGGAATVIDIDTVRLIEDEVRMQRQLAE